MLDRAHRLADSRQFAETVRRGRRSGGPHLVVHLALGPAASSPGEPTASPAAPPPRAGFVVSKAVGNAVVRNQVKRRLRHLARDRVGRLPHGSLLVVRALPAAAGASSTALAADLDRALERLLARGRGEPEPGGAR